MNSRAIWSPAWPLPSLWRQSRHRRFEPPARSRSFLIHVAFLVFGCICVVCCLNSVPVLPQWPLGLTLVNCAHARTDMQLSAQMLTIRACSVSESCKTSYWETEQLAATCELGKIHVYKWANRKSVAFPLCMTFCSSAGRSLGWMPSRDCLSFPFHLPRHQKWYVQGIPRRLQASFQQLLLSQPHKKTSADTNWRNVEYRVPQLLPVWYVKDCQSI